MKKMTQKEFKRILEESNVNFEIWGYEGILNMIAGYNNFLADDAEKRAGNGCSNIAKRMRATADNITAELAKIGYYNNIQ